MRSIEQNTIFGGQLLYSIVLASATHQYKSVQLLSRIQLFVTPLIAAHQASLSITNSQSLLQFMSIELVIPSNRLILCHLLLLFSVFPRIKVFSTELVFCIRWPKCWSFSFSISPSNEYSGLISFRIDWLGFPCSPRDSQESFPTPQFKSINSLVLSFLYRPISHPYLTIEKTIALTRQTFVGKVMALLFNMLSRLVIAFLPKSNHLLISWLRSPSAVILEAPKIKYVADSIVSLSICHEVMGPDVMIFIF